MIYLEYFLYLRAAVLWDARHLPSVCLPQPVHSMYTYTDMAVFRSISDPNGFPFCFHDYKLDYTVRNVDPCCP